MTENNITSALSRADFLKWVGAGDHASHRRMGQYEFQEKLSPAPAIEIGGPSGEFFAADFAELRGAARAEGAVNHDCGAPLGGDVKQAFFRAPVFQGIAELHEIEFFFGDDIGELVVGM